MQSQSYESLSAVHQDILSQIVGGKFKLTRLISMRLRDINNGAPLLVERGPNEAMLAVVCREIEGGLISLETIEPAPAAEDEGDFDLLGIEDELGL